MSFSKLLLLALVVLSAASSVFAQGEYRQYEITPFFGTRFGGNIDLSQQGNPNVDYLKIKSSMDYGIMGNVTFWQNFQGEFMWNRQPTSLSAHNPNDNTNSFVSNYEFRHVSVRRALSVPFSGKKAPAFCGWRTWAFLTTAFSPSMASPC